MTLLKWTPALPQVMLQQPDQPQAISQRGPTSPNQTHNTMLLQTGVGSTLLKGVTQKSHVLPTAAARPASGQQHVTPALDSQTTQKVAFTSTAEGNSWMHAHIC
jgi:hypothetical protein